MSITWIVILSLFGLIVLILVIRACFSVFKKDQNVISSQEQTEIGYEGNFIKLASILNLNQILQKTKPAKIATINQFINDQLITLTKTPEYIFNLHLLVMNDYVDILIKQKLLKNSPTTWNKKFNDEIMMLQYKIQELQNSNNSWQDLKKTFDGEILEGWEYVKNSS